MTVLERKSWDGWRSLSDSSRFFDSISNASFAGVYEQESQERTAKGSLISKSLLIFCLPGILPTSNTELRDSQVCFESFSVQSLYPLDQMLGSENLNIFVRTASRTMMYEDLLECRPCQKYSLVDLLAEKPLLVRRIVQRAPFTGSASAHLVKLIQATYEKGMRDSEIGLRYNDLLKEMWLNGDVLLREALPEISEEMAMREQGIPRGQELLDCFEKI